MRMDDAFRLYNVLKAAADEALKSGTAKVPLTHMELCYLLGFMERLHVIDGERAINILRGVNKGMNEKEWLEYLGIDTRTKEK